MATAAQGGSIICLVADRDITRTGVEVEFFKRRTTIPGGPALLSLRSGCPLLPVAIYDRGSTRECRVHAPIWPQRTGRLREDVALTTQQVAAELQGLISADPAQWHVLSALWPEAPPGKGTTP
jgi:KDO2-lipid IV(A) lauroyltransferase